MLLWVLTSVLLVLGWSYASAFNRKCSSIPVVPGLPILGNVIALGKGGLAFITQCRQQFGDVFCLRLLGQRMVFVFDPAMLTLFFKAPESSISFKPAVEQFTQRIYGLPSKDFFAHHEGLLATLRQLLVPAQLQDMGRALLEYAQPQLQQWKEQGQVDLWPACQSLVFGAAGQVLFGPAFFKRHGLQAVQDAFLSFEGQFEIAASPIPHLLLPKFRRSRTALLSMLSASLNAGDFEGTVVVQLLQGCGLPERLWPNLLLAVLWASQANSMPAMFWSLALLLLPQHAAAQERVLQELEAAASSIRKQQQQQQQRQQQQPVVQQQPQGVAASPCSSSSSNSSSGSLDDATLAAMLQLAVDKRSWVSRCVAEAIRLRLHSIAVRFVSDDNLMLPTTQPSSDRHRSTTDAGHALHDGSSTAANGQGQSGQKAGLYVPKGSILCICPIESHHDPALYPDQPWAFNPDREAIQGLAPGTVVPGVAGMGFGGGFWRFFAEMELALMLQLVLLQLNLTPTPRQQQHQQPPAAEAAAVSVMQEDRTQPRRQQQQEQGQQTRVDLAQPRPQGWLQRMAVFGLGSCGGSSKQQQQWWSSGVATAGGDVPSDVRLPRSDLRRLVGFKVPSEPWCVSVEPRQLSQAPVCGRDAAGTGAES